MTLRRLPAILIAVAALFGPARWAGAQGELPAAVVTATSPSPEQVKQITDYAQEWGPKLDNPDAAAIRNARDKLLSPLKTPAASVRFRQAYTDALVSELQKHLASPTEQVALNAMRVCGELATAPVATLLTDRLGDPKPSMRLMAAAQLGRTFNAVEASSPAITKEDLDALIDRLGERMLKEEDAPVLTAVTRALMAAVQVTNASLATVRPHAFEVMCRQGAERAKKLGPLPQSQPTLEALLRASTAARDALTANDPKLALKEPGIRLAGELNGQMLAAVLMHLKDLPQGQAQARDGIVPVVAVADSAAVLVTAALGKPYQSQGMTEDFKKATQDGDGDFKRKALQALDAMKDVGLGPFIK